MAAFSLHRFSLFRHCGRGTMLFFYFGILVIYFDTVNCASLTNSSEKSSVGNVKNENNTFAHRQLFPLEPTLALAAGNPYLHSPSLGFPFYQNLPQLTPALPHQNVETAAAVTESAPKVPAIQSQKKRVTKVKTQHSAEEFPTVSSESKEGSEVAEKVVVKNKRKKDKRKKDKLQKEENNLEKVESKTVGDDGTERGCPACIGSGCDPTLDPSTNISGIPLIQIIVALAVGAFWAAIFAFLIHNFIEYQKGDDEGYGYGPSPTPEYGAPVSQYGAPAAQYGAPQSEYGAPTGYSGNNRISYGKNGYGRSSRGYTFNDLSNWVWAGIDKFVSKYDDN